MSAAVTSATCARMLPHGNLTGTCHSVHVLSDRIWDLDQDKLRTGLMMFNRLHEPWRASPESWHLSRIYHIHSIITFTQVENISGELALKPGYHNTIVQYNYKNSSGGRTVYRAKRHSRPGYGSPGEAPTYCALPVHPKSSVPAVHQHISNSSYSPDESHNSSL